MHVSSVIIIFSDHIVIVCFRRSNFATICHGQSHFMTYRSVCGLKLSEFVVSKDLNIAEPKHSAYFRTKFSVEYAHKMYHVTENLTHNV